MSVAAVLVDGDQRIAVCYGTPLWEASCEWARFHGLDPNRIPGGSEVVRDAANRRILYSEYVFDEDGVRMVDDEPVIVSCVEQGEAPPKPFPDVH